MQQLTDWFDTKRKVVAAIVVAAIAIVGFTMFAGKARADGLPSKTPGITTPTINASSWTGCGFGTGASVLNGEVSGFTGPLNIGADGQALGGRFLCDVQMGQFVMGFNVDYDKVFGDLQTIGADTTWTVGGRVGPLVNPNTLLFVSGGWTRANTTGGDMDGWYVGGGIETKLPNSPLYLVLEYQHRNYDVTDIGGPSGVDASVDVVRAGVNVKFNFFK